MPKRLKPSIQEQRQAYRDNVIDSSVDELDKLVSPPPSLDASTSLARIDSPAPRRQGQNMTDEERLQAQVTFLEEFAKQANVTKACEIAGIHRSLVYQWLQADENFMLGWAESEQRANDVLRAEAYRRAVDGTEEPIVSMGKVVRDETTGSMLTVKKYDTPLLLTLMRARMPEYRDSRQVTVDSTVNVNTSHQLTIDTRGMSAEELAAIRQIAQAMKEREQARIEKTGKHDSAGE